VHPFGPVTVSTAVTSIEANPTSSTPSLSLTKSLHTLRMTTAPMARTRLLTVLEPTAALAPAAPAAVETPGGVDFGDELVLLSPLAHHIDDAGVRASAAAVIVSGPRIAVVAATQVARNGVVVHRSAHPWSGVLE
jgi:hypothetical protein